MIEEINFDETFSGKLEKTEHDNLKEISIQNI